MVQNTSPSQAEIDTLHATYVTALCDLFDTHKQNYGVPADVHLELL